MLIFTWSSKFLTGLPTVDEQHRRLVGYLNTCAEQAVREEGSTSAELRLLLGQLTAYAKVHFAEEEALMRAAAIDPRFIEAHVREHADFSKKVGAVSPEGTGTESEENRSLLRYIIAWLACHILGADQQLARQVDRVGRGMTAAAAYELERQAEAGPAAVLLEAVDQMLKVLAQRNARLETRVAERTEALTRSNQQLATTLAALTSSQQKLVEAGRLATVGQLSAGLAHEINNPLGAVTANVEFLDQTAGDLLALVQRYGCAVEAHAPPAARAALKVGHGDDLEDLKAELGTVGTQTREALARIARIVRDLKAFSGVDGALLQKLELERCLDGVMKVIPAKRLEGVVVERRFTAAPVVSCQAAHLNRTLYELVTNALQAVVAQPSERRRLTLATGADATRVWIEVADTGVGMSDSVRAHAFDPFFTTRGPGSGFGLGLSTAWSFAASHGGSIDLESQPDVGTRVRLWLPLERPLGVEAGAARPGAPANRAEGVVRPHARRPLELSVE